jgi:hypothetical protein
MLYVHARTRRATEVAVLALVPLMLISACSKTNKAVPPKLIINDYVTGVQVDGEAANTAVVPAELPAGTADGPTITVPGDATVVNGGSLREPITASKNFTKIRMGIQAVASSAASSTRTPSASPGGDKEAPFTPPVAPSGSPSIGYYEITLSTAANSASLVVSMAQALPGTVFVFHYALVDPGGAQGTPARQVIGAIPVGTGQIQVSVSWDVDSDVDIHVADPTKNEVYWDNTTVPSGGELDLDSNADCDLDHKRNENITWDKGAPAGTYTVRLDYFEGCDQKLTHWVVTVRVAGQPVRTFTGTFDGDGDLGGEGDGKNITTFQIAPAPSAT